jgi:zinc transporter
MNDANPPPAALPGRQEKGDPGKVVVFDGKGGVVSAGGLDHDPKVPPHGFVLVTGNSRSPEFKVWLKQTIGVFEADVLTVPSTRSRCTVADDRAMIVMRVVRPGADPNDIGRQLLTMRIARGQVIVASELNIPELLGVSQWQQTQHAPLSPADLVARLALRASDRIEPLIEALGNRLDDIEEQLISAHDSRNQSRLAQLRRDLISFRRLIWPQRDVLTTLEVEDISFFTERDRMRLREASSRSARLGDELQTLSERAVLVHEQVLDARSEQLNRTMLVLAAVTVVFLPLTLVTGALGMNVSGIPFSDEPWAFVGVCVGLVAVALGLVWWMHGRRWL